MKVSAILFICCLLFMSCSMVELLENINKEETIIKKELIKRSYDLVFSNSLDWDVGRIATIEAKPECWKITYDKYENKTNKTKTNYGYLLLASALAGGGIYLLANSNPDSLNTNDYLLVGFFTAGVIYSYTQIGKSKTERHYEGQKIDLIETITAKGQAAYLVFKTNYGKEIKIYLGKINSDNKLSVNLRRLLNTPGYNFKNEEEIFYYFSSGYIDIDWLSLNSNVN